MTKDQIKELRGLVGEIGSLLAIIILELMMVGFIIVICIRFLYMVWKGAM